MKIEKFLNSKIITEKELIKNFTIEKERVIEDQFDELNVCWNCCAPGCEIQSLPTEGWKYLQYCSRCKRINMRFKCEPMGGNHSEEVKIFKEKGDDSVPSKYKKVKSETIYKKIPGF